MVRNLAAVIVCLATLSTLAGCLGAFASNQGRRQAARSADYYVKKYAEPELQEMYADDPAAQAQAKQDTRQARNDLADTIVRTGNERQKTRVGVDDRGWLTNER